MAQKLMLGGHAAAAGGDAGAPAGLGWGLGSRQGLGMPKGALTRRQKAEPGTPAAPLRRRGALAARASSLSAAGAVGGGDVFLEEVKELPDGSLVLHYSSEGAARRKEGRLVSFLTKPVPGQRRREVPKDVLQQILGGTSRESEATTNGASVGASTLSPSTGLASFVKGVLASTESTGSAVSHEPQTPAATPTHASTGGPPSVAAAASPGAQAATAPPSRSAAVATAQLPTADPSEAAPKSIGSPLEGGSDQSGVVRAVGVILAAATFTAALRGLALVRGPWGNVPVTAPVSLYATAAVFILTSLILWVTGFASTGKASSSGALA